MYHDYNYFFWCLKKKWEDHTPIMWPKSFGNGISEPGKPEVSLPNCLASTNVIRLAYAWYWSVTILVCDSGKFCCYPCTF